MIKGEDPGPEVAKEYEAIKKAESTETAAAEKSAEPDEPAAKSERKPRIPAKPKDAPTAQEEIGQTRQSTLSPPSDVKSAQDRFRDALRECNYDQADFLAGLKLIEFPGVAADVEILEELDPATCEKILARGPEELMRDVRDVRWMKNMK